MFGRVALKQNCFEVMFRGDILSSSCEEELRKLKTKPLTRGISLGLDMFVSCTDLELQKGGHFLYVGCFFSRSEPAPRLERLMPYSISSQ